MMLYHFNLGYPLVDESSILDIGAASNLWANHNQDPCQPYGPTPRHPVSEISVHQQHTSDGLARCRLANPQNGLGVEIAYGTETLPYLQLLRVRGTGYSLIGIEPCSTAKRSRAEAREAGEMPLLAPGESRRFAIDISVFSETFEREATS